MALDIAQVTARVTEEILARVGLVDPAAINRGLCDEWANRVAEMTGGDAIWLDSLIDADLFPIDEQPRIGHCVVHLEGRWHDSEHPDGVEHCLMLAGFDADDARRYAHLVDATAYRPEVP